MTTNAPDAIPADEEAKGWIAESITEHYGERCPMFDPTCICCRVWQEFDRARSPLAAPVAEVRARYSGEDDFGERDVSWLVKPSDLPSGTKLYSAIPAPGTAPSGTAEVEPAASPASGVGVARVSEKYWSAQHGFTARETAQLLKELADIEDMLNEGQGDDDGIQIMPDFDSGMSTLAKVEKCLFLLEKRRDVIESYLAKEDWRDDPSADERWNAGLDFGMQQLCKAIGVDPKTVNWDAATETLDGDVQSVIWNILRTAYGENFPPAQSPEQGEVVREPDAELVKALSGLVTAVGKMRVPQNVSDVALLVMVTLGPALSHAQDILSKHGGNQ